MSAADNSTNLAGFVKEQAASHAEYDKGYAAALDQVVTEACLTRAEVKDIWDEYSYLVDERTRRPYDHVPVNLPLRRRVKETYYEGSKKKTRDTTERDPDWFRVDDCSHDFYRTEFYGTNDFRWAVKNHYRSLNYAVGFVINRSGGCIMKIYTNPLPPRST